MKPREELDDMRPVLYAYGSDLPFVDPDRMYHDAPREGMNTKEEMTWRLYLDEIIRRKPAAEKQRLYKAVGVTRISFQRWRGGENTPDAAHLYILLQTLPEEERERLRALMAEDPRVRSLLPTEEDFSAHTPADTIPQHVYEEILRSGRDTPERFWLLCGSILMHALTQLETYPQTGIELSIAKCMPPQPDGKIRSLREYVGKGTAPWRGDLHPKAYFLGAESLAGYAVMHHHGMMVSERSDDTMTIPVHWMEHEMSAAAYPILREGSIAGAFLVSSHASAFFTQERLTLIEKYADLLRLTFYDHEFYPATAIDLALMPSWEIQKEYFSSFRQRVHDEYKQALREGHMLDLAQAEERVRVTLESELLYHASQFDEQAMQREKSNVE